MTPTDCNKIEFASRAEANQYVKEFKKGNARHTWRKLSGTLRAYKCSRCPKFHLTTMSKAEEVQYRKRQKRKNSGRDQHQ